MAAGAAVLFLLQQLEKTGNFDLESTSDINSIKDLKHIHDIDLEEELIKAQNAEIGMP